MDVQMRADLLRLVCAELPELEATFIQSLPADEYRTHAEAYCAVRRLDITLPRDLQDRFVAALFEYLDADMAAPLSPG
jgi:hypothetical protein